VICCTIEIREDVARFVKVHVINPYAPHLSSLADITLFYQPEIPVTKNFVLAPLTSSLGGINRKFSLHAEKHS
jgi:hypothetical protein